MGEIEKRLHCTKTCSQHYIFLSYKKRKLMKKCQGLREDLLVSNAVDFLKSYIEIAL